MRSLRIRVARLVLRERRGLALAARPRLALHPCVVDAQGRLVLLAQLRFGLEPVLDVGAVGLAARDMIKQYRRHVALIYVDVVEFEASHIRKFYSEMAGRFERFLALHRDEIKLIRAAADANKKVIVVLMGGSAITFGGWADAAPSVLMAWYPGMEGGHAIAEVLCGDHNPSGRLPFMWPKDESQCVKFWSWSPVLRYDAYHGYRLADKEGFTPEFPFGFGLSYTSFMTTNLRLDNSAIGPDGEVIASVDVTNTGAVAGEETVQAYVGCKGGAVPRAKKELKAFAKVALSPGETKTVTLSVPASDLAYYDVGSKSWKVEAAEYDLFAGPCARESDLLKASFAVRK